MPKFVVRSFVWARDEDQALRIACYTPQVRWAMIDREWKGTEIDESEGLVRHDSPQVMARIEKWARERGEL